MSSDDKIEVDAILQQLNSKVCAKKVTYRGCKRPAPTSDKEEYEQELER